MLRKPIFLLVVTIAVLSQANLGLGSKVDDLLKKLEKVVDNALLKANATLEKAKAEVTEAAQQIEAGAKTVMQSTEDQLESELDGLKAKAKAAGVNIDSCLGVDEQKLVNLPTTGTNGMVDCVAGEINKAFVFAQDALKKIQTAVNDIENIRKEIKDCGHGWSSVKCLAKLATKIDKDIVSLPTSIEVDAAAAVAQITQLEKEVKKCADKAENKMESDGEALIEKIGVCVAAKIIT